MRLNVTVSSVGGDIFSTPAVLQVLSEVRGLRVLKTVGHSIDNAKFLVSVEQGHHDPEDNHAVTYAINRSFQKTRRTRTCYVDSAEMLKETV